MTEDLVDWAVQQQEDGASEQEIQQELLRQGYSPAVVEGVLEEAFKKGTSVDTSGGIDTGGFDITDPRVIGATIVILLLAGGAAYLAFQTVQGGGISNLPDDINVSNDTTDGTGGQGVPDVIENEFNLESFAANAGGDLTIVYGVEGDGDLAGSADRVRLVSTATWLKKTAQLNLGSNVSLYRHRETGRTVFCGGPGGEGPFRDAACRFDSLDGRMLVPFALSPRVFAGNLSDVEASFTGSRELQGVECSLFDIETDLSVLGKGLQYSQQNTSVEAGPLTAAVCYDTRSGFALSYRYPSDSGVDRLNVTSYISGGEVDPPMDFVVRGSCSQDEGFYVDVMPLEDGGEVVLAVNGNNRSVTVDAFEMKRIRFDESSLETGSNRLSVTMGGEEILGLCSYSG
jgi:hypothetical protein